MAGCADPAADCIIEVAKWLIPRNLDEAMKQNCFNYWNHRRNYAVQETKPYSYSTTVQIPHPSVDTATAVLGFLASNSNFVLTAEYLVTHCGANLWGYSSWQASPTDNDPVLVGGHMVTIEYKCDKNKPVVVASTSETHPTSNSRLFSCERNSLEGLRTPLHAAAEAGKAEMAKLLIRLAAQKAVNEGRHRSLWVASCEYVNKKDRVGRTALHYASRSSTGYTVSDAILSVGNDYTDTPMYTRASADGDISCGAFIDVHATDLLQGATPLHELAFQGRTDIVKRLLQGGVGYPPSCSGIADRQGFTALHWMCRYFKADVDNVYADLLLAAGQKYLALEYSSADAAPVVVCRRGLGINHPNVHHQTPLHIAVMERNVVAMAALLGCRGGCGSCTDGVILSGATMTPCPLCHCNIDSVTKKGATALHLSTMDRYPSLPAIALLLEYGAAVSPLDEKGFTPLALTFKYARSAAGQGEQTSLGLLLDCGAV